MPPGGGLEFGESVNDCLIREFREETALKINVGDLAFIDELVEPPFHALELYFTVRRLGGVPRLGSDPEHQPKSQLIDRLSWISVSDLPEISLAPGKLLKHLA